MHFNLLTLFPEMFPGCLGQSLAGKALARADWSYNAINIRDYATDAHRTVDDTPYGGGAGMVMRADVIERALLSIDADTKKRDRPNSCKRERKIYLSPRGKILSQQLVKEISSSDSLTILCGRYEGIDQRVLDAHDFEEISIGDYVLSGGEPAALIMMDAIIRLLPGVMGNNDTADNESFGANTGGLLEYPHYTRPAEWTDAYGQTHIVPDVLKEGHHAKIEQWRREQSLDITQKRRPDLLKKTD